MAVGKEHRYNPRSVQAGVMASHTAVGKERLRGIERQMNSEEVSPAYEKRQGRRPFRVSPDAVSTFAAFGVFRCAKPGQTPR